MFKTWLESSLDDLYQSAVDAFPNTTKRQHATDPIRITSFAWTPFLGMKTLFLRVRAQNEDRVYKPIILFRDVNYDDDDVYFTAADDGKEYHCGRLSAGNTDVLVRCECQDFYWRFNYYDYIDRSLYSRKRTPYEATTDRGPVNPMEMPGICKHLMKTMEVVRGMGFIA